MTDLEIMQTWTIQALRLLKSEGVLQTTKPAPLTAAELCQGLAVVAEHPDYKGQTIRYFSGPDDVPVELLDGMLVVGAPPLVVMIAPSDVER